MLSLNLRKLCIKTGSSICSLNPIRKLNDSATSLNNKLTVYNSLTKTKEPLKLNKKNLIYWYSCGPTVYDSAHIGHASSYVCFDIIKRLLTNYFKITVVNLMNITDIDDKIIKRAIQEGKNHSEISKLYEKEFLDDLKSLNCEKPSIILRVTSHVPEIVSFIQKLIDSNRAYVTKSGSVYFNTQKFKIRSFFDTVEADTELDSKENREKLHPHDFALWKSRKQLNEPAWESPWGLGRPGWHIECSTLASIAFGNDLDLHSGGKDLIFPHHHNEMVQCCAYYSVDSWSRLWLHTGHLHLKNDVKMSKSLKNTVSIRDILSKYTSNEFRMFCLLSPYRYDREFSEEIMIKSVKLSNSFISFINFCTAYSNGQLNFDIKLNEQEILLKLEETRTRIHEALSDDFNTALAIDELSKLIIFVNSIFQQTLDPNIRKTLENQNKDIHDSGLNRHYGCVMSVSNYVQYVLELFGFKLSSDGIPDDRKDSEIKLDVLIETSLKFRRAIRNLAINKETNLPKEIKELLFKYCDEFRKDIGDANIEFKDYKEETIWQIKNSKNQAK